MFQNKYKKEDLDHKKQNEMGLADTLLTFGILFSLFVLGYCKYMNKTLLEFVIEVKEIFRSQEEEVLNIQ